MKNKTTAGVLALLLGGIGIHRFYLGESGKAILFLLFCWTGIPFILGIIDGIKYLTMTDEAWDIRYNGKNPAFAQKQQEYDHLVQKKNLLIDEAELILKSDLDKGIISKELYDVRKKQLDLDRKMN